MRTPSPFPSPRMDLPLFLLAAGSRTVTVSVKSPLMPLLHPVNLHDKSAFVAIPTGNLHKLFHDDLTRHLTISSGITTGLLPQIRIQFLFIFSTVDCLINCSLPVLAFFHTNMACTKRLCPPAVHAEISSDRFRAT